MAIKGKLQNIVLEDEEGLAKRFANFGLFKKELFEYTRLADQLLSKQYGEKSLVIKLRIVGEEDPTWEGYAKKFNLGQIKYGAWDANKLLKYWYVLTEATFWGKEEFPGWITGGSGTNLFLDLSDEEIKKKKIYPVGEWLFEGTIELLAAEMLNEAKKRGLKVKGDFTIGYRDGATTSLLLMKSVGKEKFLDSLKTGNFHVIASAFSKKYNVKETDLFKMLEGEPKEAAERLKSFLTNKEEKVNEWLKGFGLL